MSQRKRNIEFSKPEEPSFLKKLKNQVGIKEDLVTVDSKKEKLSKQDLDYRDEEPTYVIEENSGITEQDLKLFQEKTKQEKDFQKDNENLEKRILFKKPVKNQSEERDNENTQSQTMKPKQLTQREKLKNMYQDKVKTVKNSSLLSFNEEDNDDDENED